MDPKQIVAQGYDRIAEHHGQGLTPGLALAHLDWEGWLPIP
jgi:hypothetical protein